MEKLKNWWKWIVLALVVLIVITVIVVCLRKDDKVESKVDVKPVNTSVSLENVFEKVKLIDGMMPVDELGSGEDVTEGGPGEGEAVKDWKDEEEIEFGMYEGLEKKAIVNTTDESVNEVWMIKLGDLKQQEDVCRILGNRVKKLKAGFEDDAVQSRVLDEAVIKQEDGIVIMIISPERLEIEETIAEAMK